jgi:hypothetical protein
MKTPMLPGMWSTRASLVLSLVAAFATACGGAGAGGEGGDLGNASDPGTTDSGTKAADDAGTTTLPHADAGTSKPGSGAGTSTPDDAGAGASDATAVDAGTDDAGAGGSDPGTVDGAAPTGAALGATIASIALANVGEGACSTNTAGGAAFETSCTGNAGAPEYWCADFAQWVWAEAGVDTNGLDAAAGSFYVYGQTNGTLHDTPSLGDAVVFNYAGDGYADHVAIVVQVNADGTIETMSGDWNGDGGTEAQFSSTSLAVLNTPAYDPTEGSTPDIMGMTISGFVSPSGGGGSPTSVDPGAGAAGCYSDTLSMQMDANACVQSASDDSWYQCDDGDWVDRSTDDTPCNGTYALP